MKKTKGERSNFVGGKSAEGVWQRIINLIPPHKTLIEPFAGEGTIARKIRPAEETILVDKVQQRGLEVPAAARFILGDGISFLDSYRYSGKEFVYADPPYLLNARSQRGRAYYEEEMSEKDHARLLKILKAINCRVLLSGYRSPLYDRELGGWESEEFSVMTRGGTKATEVLWWNYPRPATLHDYRFVGADFRARARLRKKIARAVADLSSMPALERGAMFERLAGAMGPRYLASARVAQLWAATSPLAPGATATTGAEVLRVHQHQERRDPPAALATNGAAAGRGPGMLTISYADGRKLEARLPHV